MQKFEFVLKNEKVKLYDRLAIFIFILNGVVISYFIFSNYSQIINNTAGAIALVLLLITILIYILIPIGEKKEMSFLFAVTGIGLYWILTGYWWVGIIMLLLFFLYKISKRILKILFFTDKIKYPSFPGKMIRWDELSNVILKDQLLTIDFKNNKIIQQLIEARHTSINEKEFNDFCREQLNK